MLETLDYTIRIGSTPTFYISICISTLPTQHTSFIPILARAMFFFKDNSESLAQSTSVESQTPSSLLFSPNSRRRRFKSAGLGLGLHKIVVQQSSGTKEGK